MSFRSFSLLTTTPNAHYTHEAACSLAGEEPPKKPGHNSLNLHCPPPLRDILPSEAQEGRRGGLREKGRGIVAVSAGKQHGLGSRSAIASRSKPQGGALLAVEALIDN